jgi:hypothetical protein
VRREKESKPLLQFRLKKKKRIEKRKVSRKEGEKEEEAIERTHKKIKLNKEVEK